MRALILTALMLTPLPALADQRPPEGALPLSEIIAKTEAELGPNLAWIDEVDWDDDGYWSLEYRHTDGAEVKLRLDPLTGEPLAAR